MVIMAKFVETPASDAIYKDPRKWMNAISFAGAGTMSWAYIQGAEIQFWLRATQGITVSFLPSFFPVQHKQYR